MKHFLFLASGATANSWATSPLSIQLQRSAYMLERAARCFTGGAGGGVAALNALCSEQIDDLLNRTGVATVAGERPEADQAEGS